MNQQSPPGAPWPHAAARAPVLYHDGCALCLDIASILRATIAGLRVVDLGLDPDAAFEAIGLGVRELPCLIVGGKLMPIAPHSDIADVGVHA